MKLLYGSQHIIVTLFIGFLSQSNSYATEEPDFKRVTEIQSVAWSSDSKQLLFSTNRGYENVYRSTGVKAFYLWRVNINGQGLQQITFPLKDKHNKIIHYNDANGQWSPDRTKIAFDSDRGETRQDNPTERLRQVFICNVQGKGIKQISSGRGWIDNEQPAWAPDNKHLAWMTDRNAGADIMLATVGGKELRYLAVDSNLREYYPSWSSDGKHIAYMAQSQWSRQSPLLHIYARGTSPDDKPQTTRPKVLATIPQRFGLIGICSPVNNTLAFIRRTPLEETDIWVINLNGTGLHQITNLSKKRMGANYFVRPAWSPKGDRLAFISGSRRSLPSNVLEYGIWICNMENGSVKEVALPPLKEP